MCRLLVLLCFVASAAALRNSFFYLNDLGCWTDKGDRAVLPLEGNDFRLDGAYRERENAIQKCAAAANSRGFDVFCVQHGGWCASAIDARNTYMKYGSSTVCEADGEGGGWANQCYEINTIWEPVFTPIGCFNDKAMRAIPTQEGTSSQLDGAYKSREDAVRKCARLVASRHSDSNPHTYFAIQDGGWCAAASDSRQSYNKYGATSKCVSNGKGGPWANAVYKFESYRKFRIESIGCFKDEANRAIWPAEYHNLELVGGYQQRQDALAKCARYAYKMGFSHFALQNGGWCATAKDAYKTYYKYGTASNCNAQGTGGGWANQVYKIIRDE